MKRPEVQLGTFVVLRTDGSVETFHEKPTIARVLKAIGCECVDTVNLRRGDLIMIVDDAGYETECIDHKNGHIELRPIRARKPFNENATELYWEICVPGTTHRIVGDVALVRDRDFA